MSEPGQPGAQGKWARFRSPLFSIPIVGMIYVELVYLAFTLFFILATGGVPFLVFFWLPFMILIPVATLDLAQASYRLHSSHGSGSPRAGIFRGMVVTVLRYSRPLLVLQSFFEVITELPAYVAVLIYSIPLRPRNQA